MKRIRWKAGVSPPTVMFVATLEIKRLKVSGIAPDNTKTFIKKLIKKKAVVCLIYSEPEKLFRHLQISS